MQKRSNEMKITDMHCHVLPGLDDGASSEEESLQMLKAAAEQGIEAVIATPHYSGMFKNDSPEQVRKKCRALEKRAQREIAPGFRIYPGEEIFCSEESIEKLKAGKLLTLADSRYLLIEFLPNVPYSALYRAARELVFAQYLPIFAHIERYGALRQEGRVEELIEAGAYMQMNYRHIGGRWYTETTRWCRKMLKRENIHFLGTDMHNVTTRGPQTKKAMRWLAKHPDKEYVRSICSGNAGMVLENRTIQ